jgi:glucose-6-phosphate dehydrogenase assembly protein OpcA
VAIVDRLVVDSTEWRDVPGAYAQLAELFERTAVSDIAWERTERWRSLLASLWPRVGEMRRIRVHGTAAQAYLLAGWLRSRLHHDVEVDVDPHERLEGIDLDGEPAPFPPGAPPQASDVLSSQLDRYGRDPVYEAAVRAAGA